MPHKDPEARRAYKARPENRKKEVARVRLWMQQHPIYRIYHGMIQRCHDHRKDNFHYYGGRGVTVCKEWRLSFASFKAWTLANGWKPGLLIDRKDSDGNYEPGNCRFVTASESARNRRTTKLKPSDIIEIRKYLDAGLSQRGVAGKYGVSQQQISRIRRGENWKEEVAA